MPKTALVIGAGLGGLATALRLQHQGYQVQIVEQYHQAGGRLNQLHKDGFTFDVGPSFFSMSYEFRDFFKEVNLPADTIEFEPLDPCYSVNIEGKPKAFLIYKDLEKLALEFKDIEPDFKAKAEKYLKRAGQIFDDTESLIIKRNFSSIAQYLVAMAQVPWKHAPLLFRSLWAELERNFQSEEVRIIFSLVAFFLGATPFDTPAVYSLLNYTELIHDGYWQVKGGMYQITKSLVRACHDRNIQIHYNTQIASSHIVGDKLSGFYDSTGKLWTADIYVANADAVGFRHKVMKHPKFTAAKLDSMKWTLAPFTIYLGVKGIIPDMHHHNYYLGSNFREYASNIFKSSIAPQKPYYYVNVASKSDPNCAPPGCENLFILCPVPDMRFKDNWDDAPELAQNIIADLGKRINFDLAGNTLSQTIWTPIDWKDKFDLYQGSGLGLAHDLNQVGAFRPKNKDEKHPNLYYVGASTIPGTGLPIVVISSKLTATRILQDHGSI